LLNKSLFQIPIPTKDIEAVLVHIDGGSGPRGRADTAGRDNGAAALQLKVAHKPEKERRERERERKKERRKRRGRDRGRAKEGERMREKHKGNQPSKIEQKASGHLHIRVAVGLARPALHK
jgi:hypothetical protein